jgi:hypothetical protein
MKTAARMLLFAVSTLLASAQDAKVASPNSQCDYWKINWRDSNGKVWGIATSSTRAGVIKERDNSIRFEHDYAKFFHTEFDPRFSNPSAPLCVASAHKPSTDPKGDELGDAVWLNNAKLIANHWQGKLQSAMAAYLKASSSLPSLQAESRLSGDVSPTATSTAGTTLQEYVDVMKEAQARLRDLKNILLRTSSLGDRVAAELSRATVQMEDAGYHLAFAYFSLPENIRKDVLPEQYRSDFPTAGVDAELLRLCNAGNLRACADLWAQDYDVNFATKLAEWRENQNRLTAERQRKLQLAKEAEQRRRAEQQALGLLDERIADSEDENRRSAMQSQAAVYSATTVEQRDEELVKEPSFAERFNRAWNTTDPIQETLNQQLRKINEAAEAAQRQSLENTNGKNAGKKGPCPPGQWRCAGAAY